MVYQIKWKEKAKKELASLDRKMQIRVLDFFKNKASINPKNYGAELKGDMKGIWRYRLSSYRILCHIQDFELSVLVLSVDHRKDIYR